MEVKKNDFLFFQNEVLQDLKILENRINEKITSLSNRIRQETNNNDEKITTQNNKIMEILSILSSNDEKLKVNSELSNFQNKIDEFIFLNDTKITSIEKQLSNISYKYDKIYVSNLTSPGFIGKSCEYSTVRNFLEFANKRLRELTDIKDKQNKDIKMYKEKLESLINQFKMLSEGAYSKFTLFCKELVEKSEKKCEQRYNAIEERVSHMRIENGTYSFNLLKKTDELNIEWEKIKEIKNEIFNKLDMSLTDLKKENKELVKEIEIYKKEHKVMKSKLKELSEFIKDVRFRNTMKNLSNYNTRKIFNDMSQKITYHKSNSKINEDDILYEYNLKKDNNNNNNNSVHTNKNSNYIHKKISKNNNNNNNNNGSNRDSNHNSNYNSNHNSNHNSNVNSNNNTISSPKSKIKNITFNNNTDINKNKFIKIKSYSKNNYKINKKANKNENYNDSNYENNNDIKYHDIVKVISNRSSIDEYLGNDNNNNYKTELANNININKKIKIKKDNINIISNNHDIDIENNIFFHYKDYNINRNEDSLKKMNKTNYLFPTFKNENKSYKENNKSNFYKINQETQKKKSFNFLNRIMNHIKNENKQNEQKKLNFSFSIIDSNSHNEEKDINLNKTEKNFYNKKFLNDSFSPNSNPSKIKENKYQQIRANLTPSKYQKNQNKNEFKKKESDNIQNDNDINNSKESKEILSSPNINSDSLNNSIPGITIKNINNNKGKNEKSNILLLKRFNLKKNNNLNNINNLSDNIPFEFLTHVNNRSKVNNIHKYCSEGDKNETINEKINTTNLDDLYDKISKINKLMNNRYINLNYKICKLSKQFNNFTNEIYSLIYGKKLSNKNNFQEINYLNISFPENLLNNQNINIVPKSKSLSYRDYNISPYNDINYEEQKISSKELLKKIDSFLVKKFKESK